MINRTNVYREYMLMKKISAVFTGLYLVVWCVILYNEQKEVLDIIEFIVAALWYLLPILILLCWYMCYERYLKLSLEGKEADDKKLIQKNIRLNLMRNIYWGVGFLLCLYTNAYFLIRYGKALEHIFGYYVIVFVNTIIWLIGLMTRQKRVKWKRFYYLVFAGISFVLLIIAIERANSYVFITKMNMMTM